MRLLRLRLGLFALVLRLGDRRAVQRLIARFAHVAAICALTLAGSISASAVSKRADGLQTWIAGTVIPVRSIDPSEEDFTDLEPLIDAIGGAQVVQLGEISHGAGNC